VRFDLAGDKISSRNTELFRFGVAWQLDDFHSVAQRRRDGLGVIRRADKHDAGQIERLVEVMVREAEILFGIKNLQQGTGGITSKIAADLVQFIEHKDGISTVALP